MRRLAVPAALACLAMLALPSAVMATDAGLDGQCPAGPGRVASHTEIEPSADGRSVGIDFALQEGCEAVDVSLLSYQLVAGRTPLDRPEQVLYDVSTATVSAGRVNRLEVVALPDCWSLVKLVVGRPPAGETGAALRAWDRRNTVHSRWRDGQIACADAATSPAEGDDLLGSLLQGPQPTTAPRAPGATPSGTGQRGPAATAAGDPADATEAAGTAGTERESFAPEPTSPGAATDPGDGGAGPAASTGEGVAGSDHADARRDGDRASSAAAQRRVIAADGPLPLTGTNTVGIIAASIGLVVAGTVLLRLGKRHRARHLAS